jgi:flagellar biosynthetic protein FliP
MKKIISLFGFFSPVILFAQNNSINAAGLSVSFGQGVNYSDTMQVILLFTVLTLAPAILILCTSFTRIIVVLSFMRQAVGTQNMPPNQLIVGFALFLSLFVMMPTGERIYKQSIKPYSEKKIEITQALDVLEVSLRDFMGKHVRKSDIALFYDVTGRPSPKSLKSVPIHYLIPAFIISELKTAFQIGFLLYIPFLVLDMVVASVLMAMGMMMLPPVLISLPFKILLFVLVDGWQLVTGSILKSFG